MKSSWRTTVAGIVALIGGALMAVAQGYETEPEWVGMLGLGLSTLGGSLGLLFARDNGVSSQDVGIRSEKK